MSYSINAGVAISLDNSTWYSLTDHNRQQITVTPTLIEHAQRMANGRMKKYVVASKKTISTFNVVTKHRNVNFDYVDMEIEFTEI